MKSSPDSGNLDCPGSLMLNKDHQVYLGKLANSLRRGELAVFAGAGLSIGAGYADWAGLSKNLAEELGLAARPATDLPELAQFYVNKFGRQALSQHLLDNIGSDAHPTKNHELLAKMPISRFWTTNYDALIENALEQEGKNVFVKWHKSQLTLNGQENGCIVFKMHGDSSNTAATVFTKDDYRQYESKLGPFLTTLSRDLTEKTFLFIGFSFTDPNLEQVLNTQRAAFCDNQRTHYCVFKTVNAGDYANTADYDHDLRLQEHTIEELEKYNLKTVLVNSYNDIPKLLTVMHDLNLRRTVYFSGAAAEFDPFTEEEVSDFLYELGQQLISRGFNISIGMGKGVGNALCSGALRQLYDEDTVDVHRRIHMAPFPRWTKDEEIRKSDYRKHREQLIRRAGIALFFMGNKYDGEKLIPSPGCYEEFNMSCERGLIILPIGWSGHAAHEIYQKILADPDTYFQRWKEIKPHFDNVEALSKTMTVQRDSLIKGVEPIVDLLEVLANQHEYLTGHC